MMTFTNFVTYFAETITIFIVPCVFFRIRVALRTMSFQFIVNKSIMVFKMFFRKLRLKMIWIYTTFILAKMMYPSSIWYFAYKYFIRISMSKYSFVSSFSLVGYIKKSIALVRKAASPFPATIRGNLDFLYKTCNMFFIHTGINNPNLGISQ